SAHASSGAGSSSSPSAAWPVGATVVGVAAWGAGAAGAGLGGSPPGLLSPPLQPARVAATAMPSRADQGRLMGPPRSRFAKERRILTEASQAVNSTSPKRRLLAGCVLALLLIGAGNPPRIVPTHGELRLLAIRASFADVPLVEPREHFAGAPDSLL